MLAVLMVAVWQYRCHLAMGMISLPASMLALNCKILLLSPAMPILAPCQAWRQGQVFRFSAATLYSQFADLACIGVA
jgi:hypothetical protein